MTRRNRIPSLPPGFSGFYDPARVSHDHRILMMASLAKDPAQAQALMDKYQAATALDVLNAMPRRQRTWQQKLRALMQRITGNLDYDPLPGMMREKPAKTMKITYRLRSVEGSDDE